MPDNPGVNLMGYLPPYHHENEEMICITDAENPEVDALALSLLQVRDNQFILTADDTRIRQWENLLRIRPDYAKQSLEYRKAVVIMRLSTRLPLTYRWLKEKVAETDSTGEYVIKLIHDLYQLTVRLGYDDRELADDLRIYLREKIPANLSLTMEVYFEILSTIRLYVKPFFTQVNARTYIRNGTLKGEVSSRLFCGHINKQHCRVIIS